MRNSCLNWISTVVSSSSSSSSLKLGFFVLFLYSAFYRWFGRFLFFLSSMCCCVFFICCSFLVCYVVESEIEHNVSHRYDNIALLTEFSVDGFSFFCFSLLACGILPTKPYGLVCRCRFMVWLLLRVRMVCMFCVRMYVRSLTLIRLLYFCPSHTHSLHGWFGIVWFEAEAESHSFTLAPVFLDGSSLINIREHSSCVRCVCSVLAFFPNILTEILVSRFLALLCAWTFIEITLSLVSNWSKFS